MPELRIHELHHHVLSSWYELKSDLPQVITLDHHTDILPAFLRYTENNPLPADCGINPGNDIKFLRHDEHFDYALKYGLISKAVIISQTPAVTAAPANLQVLYNEKFPEDEPLNSEKYRNFFDNALEDSFLEQFQEFLPHENYILDIDCDYFKTEKSLNPAKSEIFSALLQNARMITISLERDWVRLLTFESPAQFTADYIVRRLKEKLPLAYKRAILSNPSSTKQ